MLTQRYHTGFIEPTKNIPQLEKEILSLSNQPTLVIYLTRGKLAPSLSSIAHIPQWNSFSIGRVREATKVDLPTSGHILSHNTEEIRNQLIDLDTSRILVLDDTSFSGTTSLLVESLLKQAFPDRKIKYIHGFLIVNTGKLGNLDGAFSQISKSGSRVISGFRMETPKDDGWHFFDIVDQDHIEDHFLVVREILGLLKLPNFEHAILYTKAIFFNTGKANDILIILYCLFYSIPIFLYHMKYLLREHWFVKKIKKYEVIVYAIMLFFILCNGGNSDAFIYFQF